jgi:tRNA threonylcarbamoyladenosine biosynthesis protein TsaE
MDLKIQSIEELPKAAKDLLEFAGNQRVFLFFGEMGAGKTTFIKAICKTLGVSDSVSSPTFSIVNEYSAGEALIYHFDFYRLKKQTEALDLGYEDYLYSGNYCFIEWPEKISELLPERYVEVKLEEMSKNERLIKIRKLL